VGLGDDPHPPGSRNLSGYVDVFRIRVGVYRVLYSVEGRRLIVIILKIGDRKGARSIRRLRETSMNGVTCRSSRANSSSTQYPALCARYSAIPLDRASTEPGMNTMCAARLRRRWPSCLNVVNPR